MVKSAVLQLLNMYSLSYSGVLKESHLDCTVLSYRPTACRPVKVDYRNNEFIVKRDLDIIAKRYSPMPESIEINGTIYWKDDYGKKWFILKEEVFTCLFGEELLVRDRLIIG